MDQLPVVDLSNFLNGQVDTEQCRLVAQLLHDTGILLLRDPRVSEADNEQFLQLMEKYYSQPDDVKKADSRPELSFQVGVTPEHTEVARDPIEKIESLAADQRPHPSAGADPKWRFHWRIGPRPAQSKYPELNAPQVVPQAFVSDWAATMDMWGNKMIHAVETVAEMMALGMDLPREAFVSRMKNGPHLLAPTGSDLGKYSKIGTVFAAFHYDLNFLTCHGKSRFPGLYVWLRNGQRMKVSVPTGCLLVQAGKQAEWLTGGFCTAGFHEVVVTEDTLKAVEKAKQEERCLWRVSSTCFSHINSDVVLQPLDKFATPETLKLWPPTDAGQQVTEELEAISLAH